MARQPRSSKRPSGATGATDAFRIGPFVLETLTTGMYEGSTNALREYVQNAFDSTVAAAGAGILPPGSGKVVVTLPDQDMLVISDNGTGLSVQSAWSTLTAIGASKKKRSREAGFRGIGRLAAIAFCDTLSFRTKVAGEAHETTVTFDCTKLRQGMLTEDTVSTLADLLKQTVTHKVAKVRKTEDHFMVVTLEGLTNAPAAMRSIDDIRSYLAETSPIAFDPEWSRGREIEGEAKKAGRALTTIKLHVGETEKTAVIVHKLYGDVYRKARANKATGGTTTLSRVDYRAGTGWWAWVGIPRDAGLLADAGTSGLRIRMKNIQVDGTTIMDRLFAEENESYARFNKYHVGEIHIDQTAVVPNARRDGFEDDAGWRSVRENIYAVICEPLRAESYERSDAGKKTVDAIKVKVNRLNAQVDAYFKKPERTPAQWAAMMSSADKLRVSVNGAVTAVEPEGKSPLRAQLSIVERMVDRLEGKLEPDAEGRLRRKLREEILTAVEQIIQPYLATDAYARVRKLLHDRIT